MGKRLGMWTARGCGWCGGVLGGLGVLAATTLGQEAEVPFAPLTGSHPVGTVGFLWEDADRDESFTSDPDDVRLVPVQVWYPAAPGAEAERAPYLLDPDEFRGSEVVGAANVRSRSFLDAPLAGGEETFPVLVFHHGGGWTRFSSSFVTEELASHGYVVFSVGHIGFNQTRYLPDGSPLELAGVEGPEPTGDLAADAQAGWQYLDEVHFPVWRADAAFALDRIEAANATRGDFAGRLDLDHLGMLGWSFGGATSIQMLRDDPRVKAAADLDGQLFGDVAEHGVERPYMLMHSDLLPSEPGVQEEVMAGLKKLVQDRDASFRARSKAPGWDVVLAGAQHGSFSDLVLFYPRVPGDLEPARAHRIICDYTQAFFDRYLRGMDVDMPPGPSDRHPEVKAIRHPTSR